VATTYSQENISDRKKVPACGDEQSARRKRKEQNEKIMKKGRRYKRRRRRKEANATHQCICYSTERNLRGQEKKQEENEKKIRMRRRREGRRRRKETNQDGKRHTGAEQGQTHDFESKATAPRGRRR
jgi:hypothetical protein